jgi:hypothetical protein
MDKKPYETPRLETLGRVRELTALTAEKCTGSADAVLPRVVPDQQDFACNIDVFGGGT